MTGIPPAVLAERLTESLRKAAAYNEARDCPMTRTELDRAKYWLDKLREAI